MAAFIWSQFRYRRRRAAALASAILVAATSFVLLTSAAQTSSLQIHGSVKSAFRPAYDILVRPRGSTTALERRSGLVRANYLSGIFGGITLRQYGQIKHLRDVDVAAPIANIGYILPSEYVPLHLDSLVNNDPFQLYRIKYSYVADRGNSRYPSHTAYVYFTRRDRFLWDNTHGWREIFRGRVIDHRIIELRGVPTATGPFASTAYLQVFSARSPGSGSDESAPYNGYQVGKVRSVSSISFPLLVAAIDPVQESRLLGLEHTLVAGRYLREGERPRIAGHTRLTPVIASTRVYADEALQASVERLSIPRGVAVPMMLDSEEAYGFLSRLPGKTLKRVVVSPASVYEQFLRKHLLSFAYWTPANVHYRFLGKDRIMPSATTNPISTWEAAGQMSGSASAPGSNRDVQFRQLRPHVGDNHFSGGAAMILNTPALEVIGRYDPSKLQGFSPLSQVPLETYHPPLLEPADAASRHALHGKPLLPTQNLGD